MQQHNTKVELDVRENSLWPRFNATLYASCCSASRRRVYPNRHPGLLSLAYRTKNGLN